MPKYYTGIVLSRGEQPFVCRSGRGWKASSPRPARAAIRNNFAADAAEVIIEASNPGTAEKALNLIQTAHELLDGAPEMFNGSLRVTPADPAEYRSLYPNPLLDPRRMVQTAGFTEACHLAAIASTSRRASYALALYSVSQTLHSNHPMDLCGDLRPDQRRSPIPHDHVRFAYSIITAYAVLEQLGLGLHGSAFDKGQWIPDQKANLESRLTQAGIDPRRAVLWHLRGGRTRLELRRRTRPIKKPSWAGGTVRDEEVPIVDAIADLRWLRSCVAAHDVKELASLLSVYDVANAQSLARHCILSRLGFKQK